jgi:hypothetical protein
MLTVIVPYRAGQKACWTAERLASLSSVGVRVALGGKTITVTFSKSGLTAPTVTVGRK